jgi:hypothetical protein
MNSQRSLRINDTVNEATPMKAITPKGRLSYPHLFEPQIPPGATEAV